jgi:hypothetical protein
MGSLLVNSPNALAFNRILHGPPTYNLKAHPSSEDVEEAITDGPNDRGVDAVVIEERAEGNIVHLFQIKCVSDFEKASNNFPSKEIDKLLSFIAEVLQKKVGS